MDFKNYNDALRVLGLRSGANEETVKTTYRNLLKLYHPDNSNGEFVNQRYYEIQDAYEYLEKYFSSFKQNTLRGAENFNTSFSNRPSRIIGDADRPKEMHYRDVSKKKSMKADEERRKRQAEELKKREADSQYNDAMAKIHAIRAAERAAEVIEAMMKEGKK